MEERIEKIEKIDKSHRSTDDGITEVEGPITRMAPNREHFDSLVNNAQSGKAGPPEAVEPAAKTSLLDEVRDLNQQVNRVSKVTSKDLVAQASGLASQIEKVKEKLATPNLELRPATQTLLQNKLVHIDENLRVALSKAGLEYAPSKELESKSVNPIERFLGFLTHGQSQLASLSGEVNTMHLNQKEISPANMLRIQLKMGYITQEIEFFSAVLNKALESTKTIMNIQV